MRILYHHRTQGEEPESVHIAAIVTALRRSDMKSMWWVRHASIHLAVSRGPLLSGKLSDAPRDC